MLSYKEISNIQELTILKHYLKQLKTTEIRN